MKYLEQQLQVIESPLNSRIFLSGPAGSGKTSAGVERVRYLVENGVPAQKILVFVPQRALAAPYSNAFSNPTFPPGGQPVIATIGGLARRLIEIFWPVAAEKVGFNSPDKPPIFLTLESAQYFMAHLLRPLIENHGYFSSVTIQRNRLYSQILDNLNKSAVKGFPHQEIAQRLKNSWIGDPGQSSIFDDAQHCAELFRKFCLKWNLLDFSLQIEILTEHLIGDDLVRGHFLSSFSHLLYDNIEEDVPASHRLISSFEADFQSLLLIFDQQAGFRSFLGADPASGLTLKESCSTEITFKNSLVIPDSLEPLPLLLNKAITGQDLPDLTSADARETKTGFSIIYRDYQPEMIRWVGERIAHLVESGVPASEIVVLAPFLSDTLRFVLQEELNHQNIQSWSHRPSRALREEPASKCLLTLAAVAHPMWDIPVTSFDLTYALLQSLDGIDLTRAHLLAENCLDYSQGLPALSRFQDLNPELKDRISFSLGTLYQSLADWIHNTSQQPPQPLDHFLTRLFGEILSQPGFGFHQHHDRAQTAAILIQSAKNFRQTITEAIPLTVSGVGKEYYLAVQEGILAALYLSAWEERPENAVLLAPSYSFLVRNYPVNYQFWLNAGSRGWYERIYQPLTHPYVLDPKWEIGKPWTDKNEVHHMQQFLKQVSTGLIRRCREHIFFCLAGHDDQGYEQSGLLIKSLNRLQHHLASAADEKLQ